MTQISHCSLVFSSMATQETRKGLNPEAAEFIPRKGVVAIFNDICFPPPPAIFSSFYYNPRPSSLPHLPSSFPNPLLYPSCCFPNQPSLLTPQHHSFLPAPAPPVNESPLPSLIVLPEQAHEKERENDGMEQEVVAAEKVNSRGSVIKRGFRGQCYSRREGFEKRHNKQEWKRRGGGVNNGGNYNNMQKKKQLEEIVPVQEDGSQTTVMIRNVPNKYTRKMLLHFLEEHCWKENQKVESEKGGEAEENILSAFDFLYLPMDFKTGLNRSYAFVNFTNPRAVWKFHLTSHNQKWELFHSSKIREIACARFQGKEALIKHLERMTFVCDSEEYLPVCFSPPRDGSKELVNETLVGKRISKHTSSWEPHNPPI